jgi:hypothetical protein
MKKIFYILSCFIIGLYAINAQGQEAENSIKNKKGVEVLPQAGDW